MGLKLNGIQLFGTRSFEHVFCHNFSEKYDSWVQATQLQPFQKASLNNTNVS